MGQRERITLHNHNLNNQENELEHWPMQTIFLFLFFLNKYFDMWKCSDSLVMQQYLHVMMLDKGEKKRETFQTIRT